MKKILIVDDEKPIVEILQYNLEKEGYQVITAYDGEEALEKARQETPDLVLLDIMLPKKDGFSVCRELRSEQNIPIIMLTAKELETDKVLGLELGADDYVTKPFSSREIIARIRAILRRSEQQEAFAKGIPDRLSIGTITVDRNQVQVYKQGVPIELTLREYNLLVFLMSKPGFVFSREHLLNKVWGYEYIGEERTVDVTVRRLREKLEKNPASPELIHTKRGVGYFFRRG